MATAQSIAINNAGFEALTGSDPIHFDAFGKLRDGHFSRTTAQGDPNLYVTADPIPGWTVTGLDLGTSNVPLGAFPAGNPEGQNVAYIGGTDGGGVFSQILASALTPGAYTLRVDVGRSAQATSFAGYNIQFLAGGTVLAQDNNTLIPANGTFVTSNVLYSALPGDSNLGGALRIRITALTPGNRSQTIFDNVRLNFVGAAATPEPGSLALLAGMTLGGAGFLARRRRRQRHRS